MPRISAWLTDPEVELPGPLGRRYTFSTDGRTSRIVERPGYDPFAPPKYGAAWPAAKSADRSPWLVASPVALAPGQTLITDGKRAWPKDRNARRFTPPVPIEDSETPTAEEEDCIPATVDFVLVDPFTDPLNVGDTVTFTADGASGTAPLTYEWYIRQAGVPVLMSTDETFIHTITEDDVSNKDEFGLGKLFIYVVVFNACNEAGASTDTDGSYNVQGDPP